MDNSIQINKFQQKNIVAETISAILVSKNFTEASELLEIDRSTLYKRLEKHPEIKEVAQFVQEYSQDALKMASAKAVAVLVRALESPSVEIRINASREILDRIGLSKNNPNINIQVNDNQKPEPLLIKFTRSKDDIHT